MRQLLALFILIIAFGFINAQERMNEELTLNEAIEIGLKNNPEALSALKEIDAANGRILQAGRLQNAELSIIANEVPSDFAFDETGELDLNFNQPIEFFGKRRTRIQSAEYQKRIAELNYNRVKKLVSSKVKKVYSAGLLSNQIVESTEIDREGIYNG